MRRFALSIFATIALLGIGFVAAAHAQFEEDSSKGAAKGNNGPTLGSAQTKTIKIGVKIKAVGGALPWNCRFGPRADGLA